MEYCHTDNQTANVLTRPLAQEKHMTHMTSMGLALV